MKDESMKETTDQIKVWNSNLGKEYTDRNPLSSRAMNDLYLKNFGLNRSFLNHEFLDDLDRSIKILEVGTNVGTQLQILQEMGFLNLYGIELQSYAVELSKAGTKNINLIQGNVFDLPFKDGFFDLVFTSGVLIHISPDDISLAFDEIFRCTNKYIWGYEYYAEEYVRERYRGYDNLLWKANFVKLYCEQFPDLKLVKEKHLKYLASENIDHMFLLKKK